MDHVSERRCKGQYKGKPCMSFALEGSDFCKLHGRMHGYKEQDLKNYQLNKFRARVARMSNSSGLKSLHEEIGITRMMLETLLNRCADDTDLMMASSQISQLVMNLEKLILSATKLDINLGKLLDRNKAMQLADEIVAILTAEIEDEALIARVAAQLTAAINRITVDEQ